MGNRLVMSDAMKMKRGVRQVSFGGPGLADGTRCLCGTVTVDNRRRRVGGGVARACTTSARLAGEGGGLGTRYVEAVTATGRDGSLAQWYVR